MSTRSASAERRCRTIIREPHGSRVMDIRRCGSNVPWHSSTTNIGGCSTRRRRASRAAWRRFAACGKRSIPVFVRIDPLVPARSLAERQDDGRFRPAGRSTAGRPGGSGPILPGNGREADRLLGGEDHAASARPLSAVMEKMKRVYEHLSPRDSLAFRGGAWRLPESVAAQLVVNPFQRSVPATWHRSNGVQGQPDRHAVAAAQKTNSASGTKRNLENRVQMLYGNAR